MAALQVERSTGLFARGGERESSSPEYYEPETHPRVLLPEVLLVVM